MRATRAKSVITSVLIAGLISSHTVVALDQPNLTGAEAAAISVAVEAFKKIYAKPNLRHYTVELARQILSRHPGTVGGGTINGPAMTYVVSLKTFKILRHNFYR